MVLVGAFALVGCQSMSPATPHEEQELLSQAETTFNNFARDPDMTWLQRHFASAKAIIIAPKIVKAGWIFGGSGGRAVVFARDPRSGRWMGPAFYNVGAASVGFQAGVDVSETITLVMTDKGLNTLLSNSVKLGGDASVAAGPVGAGANADVTTDFVAFSRSKGVYGGLNLEGTVIAVANDVNRNYYGSPVLPPDILVTGRAHSHDSDRLVNLLDRGTGGKM
ncbi:MAG TPA: lipid-binding SYLF domain-containing protein [Casimicrobiaceae bacterium]|jgi:lipid-binding SYLF domain-containing protein|nr:lipid-binding SYLF domain-containing protein [Casimicrobiaceae bacterium]